MASCFVDFAAKLMPLRGFQVVYREFLIRKESEQIYYLFFIFYLFIYYFETKVDQAIELTISAILYCCSTIVL